MASRATRRSGPGVVSFTGDTLNRPWSAAKARAPCPIHGAAQGHHQASPLGHGQAGCSRRGCEACASKLELSGMVAKAAGSRGAKGRKGCAGWGVGVGGQEGARTVLEERVRELEGQVERGRGDRVRLVSAMEAEEKCMVGVFQELEDAKKKLQEMYDRAQETVQDLSEKNEWLAASYAEEQALAHAASEDLGKARDHLQALDERCKDLESMLRAKQRKLEMLESEVQSKDKQLAEQVLVIADAEKLTRELSTSVRQWQEAAAQKEMEARDERMKAALADASQQELLARINAQEASLQSAHAAVMEVEQVRARDRMSVEERLRVREKDLIEALQRLEGEVLRLREEARREREQRMDAESKPNVVSIIELERRLSASEQESLARREKETQAAQVLRDSRTRLDEALAQIQALHSTCNVYKVDAKAANRELLESRDEVAYLERVLRHATEIMAKHAKMAKQAALFDREKRGFGGFQREREPARRAESPTVDQDVETFLMEDKAFREREAAILEELLREK